MHEGKPYHHGDLKNTLIAAGIAALDEMPVDQISLREIARRAGVSHAAPYRHFTSCSDLFCQMAVKGLDNLRSYIGPALGCDAADRYISFARMHPAMARLIFQPHRWCGDGVIHPVIEAKMQEIAELMNRPEWISAHGIVSLELDGFLSTK